MRLFCFIITALTVSLILICPLQAQAQYIDEDVTQPLSFGSFTYAGTVISGTTTVSTNGQSSSPIMQPFIIGNNALVTTTTDAAGSPQYSFTGNSVNLQGSNGGSINCRNFVVIRTSSKPSSSMPGLTEFESEVNGTITIASGTPLGTFTGFIGLNITIGGLSTSASIPISLTINPQLGAEEITPLNFGSMLLMGGASARIRIDSSNGSRSIITGTANLMNTSPPSQGQFQISGIANSAITVSIPSSATIYQTGGGGTMTVNTFTRHPNALNPVLDSGGLLYLNIGGDLHIGSNQPAGLYTGSYTITVNY